MTISALHHTPSAVLLGELDTPSFVVEAQESSKVVYGVFSMPGLVAGSSLLYCVWSMDSLSACHREDPQ